MARRSTGQWDTTTPSPALEQLLVDFLDHRRATVGRATFRRDAAAVERLLEHARCLDKHAADAFEPDATGTDPGDLTRADVNVVLRCVTLLLQHSSSLGGTGDPTGDLAGTRAVTRDDIELAMRQLGRWIGRHRALGRQSRVLAMLLERCPAPFSYGPPEPTSAQFPRGVERELPALPFPGPPETPQPEFPRLVPALPGPPTPLPVRQVVRRPAAASSGRKLPAKRPRHLRIVP